MTERPEYKNKPLVEAIYELFADVDTLTAWNSKSFASVSAKLPEYTSHEEHLKDIGIQLQVGPDGIFKPKPYAPRDRIRRWDVERLQAVQFGANMCAYNVMGPAYTHFQNHVTSLRDVIHCYLEEARPERLAWVGQRYINAIRIPIDEIDVASYFSIYPKLPPNLVGHRPLAIQVQTATLGASQVIVDLSLQQTDDLVAVYTLDIYARSAGEVPVELNALINWHRETHEAVHDAFELSISERSREELFKRIR